MSNHLETKDALALLNQLKATVQEFATREEKINADFRTRSAAEEKAFEAARESRVAQNAELLSQAEAGHRESIARCEARFEERKKRISRSHMESRRRAMDAIHEQEGKRKYKVQEGTLNAEKRREACLGAAAAALEEFETRVTQAQHALLQLGTTVRNAFSGYGGITRMLSGERPVSVDAALEHEKMLAQSN
ncbi:MAG TPA: hypothetical protein VK327_09655, partial [Candidatus Paceibacterota bacterium]|nr:hypothetical protein [Candidatus Paceibacterota bacterium]